MNVNTVKSVSSGKKFLMLLIALALILSLSGCSYYIGDSKQWLDHFDVSAIVGNDGSMDVTQTWQLHLEDRDRDYSNFYVTFQMDHTQFDAIENISVYDVDYGIQYSYEAVENPNNIVYGTENTYYLYPTSNTLEVGFYIPRMTEGTRNLQISYRVTNMIHTYRDTAVLYWQFVGEGLNFPVTAMHCDITFPDGAAKSDIRAWLHSTAASSNLAIDAGNKVSFDVMENPAQTIVEPRICMPVSLFPNSTRYEDKEMLQSIAEQEQKWADDYAAAQKRAYLLRILDAVAGAVLVIAAIIVSLKLRAKNKRFPVNVPEYIRDIPQNETPAGMAPLFYYYKTGVGEKEKDRVLSATILNLAHKKYLTITPNESGGFILTPSTEQNIQALKQNEQTIFQLFLSVALENSGQFTMEDFKRYGKKHFKQVDLIISSFFSQSQNEAADKKYFNKSSFGCGCSILSFVAAIFLFVIFMSTDQFSTVFTMIGAVLSALIFAVLAPHKTKLTEKGEYDYMIWKGLEKYMLDFSRMKEYEVPQLVLWEEYLIYATAMGISKQVVKQLPLVYPELNDEIYLHNNYYGMPFYMMMSHQYSASSGDFSSHLASNLGSVRSAVNTLAHPPASSGGGGGFGGGGFGGGGGGGGGVGGGAR